MCLQAAELLFGANGRPHDYLQAALFRLLAVGFVGAAAENWVLKVFHPTTAVCACVRACVRARVRVKLLLHLSCTADCQRLHTT